MKGYEFVVILLISIPFYIISHIFDHLIDLRIKKRHPKFWKTTWESFNKNKVILPTPVVYKNKFPDDKILSYLFFGCRIFMLVFLILFVIMALKLYQII